MGGALAGRGALAGSGLYGLPAGSHLPVGTMLFLALGPPTDFLALPAVLLRERGSTLIRLFTSTSPSVLVLRDIVPGRRFACSPV